MSASPWWRHAVTYQIYVRSFADSDGDGLGDLPAIRSRLPYLASLGVDAVWLTPVYPTADRDHGHDVVDYYDVDSRLGSLSEFDALLADAHGLGLRVLVDLVPNPRSGRTGLAAVAQCGGPRLRDRTRRSSGVRRGPRPEADEDGNRKHAVAQLSQN